MARIAVLSSAVTAVVCASVFTAQASPALAAKQSKTSLEQSLTQLALQSSSTGGQDGSPTQDQNEGSQTRAEGSASDSNTNRAQTAHTGKKKSHLRHDQERSVNEALKRLLDNGEIDQNDFDERSANYRKAQFRLQKFSGTRRTELAAVLGIVAKIAKDKKLTVSRVEPLWLTLQRNLEWWNKGKLLTYGQRVEFPGSELVWQYYPGQGLQLQVLANFGKLNGLWMTNGKQIDKLGQMVDELLPLATERNNGLAWEYYFSFGGGQPPWTSAMAQATALQALARSSVALNRPELAAVAKQGLKIFENSPPNGIRVREENGAHYLLYSFAPSLKVLNGFLQSLVGLYDYATITGDTDAFALFEEGKKQALVEVPKYDTGAWSLYSFGSSTSESPLNYHELSRNFLDGLCKRTDEATFCNTAARFTRYLSEEPKLTLKSHKLQTNKDATVRFRVSKVGHVRVLIKRGSRIVLNKNLGLTGRGVKSFQWKTPRKAGDYAVALTAIDYAGNRKTIDDKVALTPHRSRDNGPSSARQQKSE